MREALSFASLGLAASVVAGCQIPERSNPHDPANAPGLDFRVYSSALNGSNIASLPAEHLVLEATTDKRGVTFRFLLVPDPSSPEATLDLPAPTATDEMSAMLALQASMLPQGVEKLQAHRFRVEACKGGSCAALEEVGVFISSFLAPLAPLPVQLPAGAGQSASTLTLEDVSPGRIVCWRLARGAAATLAPEPPAGSPCGVGPVSAQGETVTVVPDDPAIRESYPVVVWTDGDDGPSPRAWTSAIYGPAEMIAIGPTSATRVSLGQGTIRVPGTALLAAGPGSRLATAGTSGDVRIVGPDGDELQAPGVPPGGVPDLLVLTSSHLWARTPGGLEGWNRATGSWEAAACAPDPEGNRNMAAVAGDLYVVRNAGNACVLARVVAGGCVDEGSLDAPLGGICHEDLVPDPYGDGVWIGGDPTGGPATIRFKARGGDLTTVLTDLDGYIRDVDPRRGRALVLERDIMTPRHLWVDLTGAIVGEWHSFSSSGQYVAYEPATGTLWAAAASEPLVRTDDSGLFPGTTISADVRGPLHRLSDGTLIVPTGPRTVLRVPALDGARPEPRISASTFDEVTMDADGTVYILTRLGNDWTLTIAPGSGEAVRTVEVDPATELLLSGFDAKVFSWSASLGTIPFAHRSPVTNEYSVYRLEIPGTGSGPVTSTLVIDGDLAGSGYDSLHGFGSGAESYALVAIGSDTTPLRLTGFAPLSGDALATSGSTPCNDLGCTPGFQELTAVPGGTILGSFFGVDAFNLLRDGGLSIAIPPPENRCLRPFSSQARFTTADGDTLWYLARAGMFDGMTGQCEDQGATALTAAVDCVSGSCEAASVEVPDTFGMWEALVHETDRSVWVADSLSSTLTLWRVQDSFGSPTLVRERTIVVPEAERLLRP